MKFEAIAKGTLISGIKVKKVLSVMSVDPLGDNVMTVIHKANGGCLGSLALSKRTGMSLLPTQ